MLNEGKRSGAERYCREKNGKKARQRQEGRDKQNAGTEQGHLPNWRKSYLEGIWGQMSTQVGYGQIVTSKELDLTCSKLNNFLILT